MSRLVPGGKPGNPVPCSTCGHMFPQDPPFQVACRQCGALPNRYCKRPSGHSGKFTHFHVIRDLDALAAGYYDHGDGSCGPNSDSQRAREIFRLHNYSKVEEGPCYIKESAEAGLVGHLPFED